MNPEFDYDLLSFRRYADKQTRKNKSRKNSRQSHLRKIGRLRSNQQLDEKVELMLQNNDKGKSAGTNETLISYGFDSERERTELFLAYGKYSVRRGLDLVKQYLSSPNQQNVVALIDIVARDGYEKTQKMLRMGVDISAEIVAEVKNFYTANDNFETTYDSPFSRISMKALRYLVQRYIFESAVEQPTPLHLTVAAPDSNGVNTLEEILLVNQSLEEENLSPAAVINAGTFVIYPKTKQVYFLDNKTVDVLAQHDIKPQDFRQYERDKLLSYFPSKNKGFIFVTLPQEPFSDITLLRRTNVTNAWDAVYRHGKSSHYYEHLFEQGNK